MALIKEKLEADFLKMFTLIEGQEGKVTPESAARDLATVIHNYVSTADVIVNPGQAVSAPPPAGTGFTTSQGTGKLK